MQVGIDSFVGAIAGPESAAGELGALRVQQMMEEVELADRSGVDIYSIGEHHRVEYIASSPATLLAAAAARTEKIKLGSAVTVLSSDDPVRVFQQFATVDLISKGRAEIVVGRGSFTESYPLFGYDLQHYDELFSEKLDLLLKLREETRVTWHGEHRASLTGQGVWPRPMQAKLPIRLGAGGTPQSFVRAGVLGLPLTVAIIGGEAYRFKPLVDLYREAGKRAGHDPATLDVAVHGIGFIADNDKEAADTLYPAHQETFNRIGKERGWGPQSRAQFDAQVSERGAFFVGSPETVARKMWATSDALGGVSRITLMISGGTIAHEKQLRSIELLGIEVGGKVRSTSSSLVSV